MADLPQNPIRMLVPIDGTPLGDHAIAYAASIARAGDDVLLLHVAPSPKPPQTFRGFDMPMTDQDIEKLEDHAKRVTERAATFWIELIPRITQYVAFGDPADRILQLTTTEQIDFIVMASHARGVLGRWRYGSVTDEVARSARVPVLIVRPFDAESTFGPAAISRFIVPLDGSELADRAVPIAEDLAKRMGRPIHLIRVSPGALAPGLSFGEVAADAVSHDAAIAAEHNAGYALEEIAVQIQAAGISVTWDVEIGDAVQRICETANHGDVIVLASHGRGGLDRVVHGSVTEKLVRRAEAPVVVVPSN